MACAQPGTFTSINYAKADLWAAATIAYEIYGQANPFSGGKRLNSRSYREDQLPPLPTDVPSPIKALVAAMLSRNPNKVSTVYQVDIILWNTMELLVTH